MMRYDTKILRAAPPDELPRWRGWLKRAGTPWRPTCGADTYEGCMRELIASRVRGEDALITRCGEDPNVLNPGLRRKGR